MGQVTALTLHSDAANTEVHTFNPISCTPGKAEFVERVGNISTAYPKLITSFVPETVKRKTNRVGIRLKFPLERQVGDPSFGDYKVDHVAEAIIEVVLPSAMLASEREDFYHLIVSALDDTNVSKYITDLEPMY